MVRQRIEGMARHRGLDLAGVEIHVITAPVLRLDRDPDRTRLLETTRRLRPRLLLLDPLVRLHGIDENHAGEVAELLAYFRSLQRQLDLSVLLVHHTRKNAAGGVAAGAGLRGSGDIHAFGDSNLYLRRTKEHLVLSSEHRAAPASPPVALELVATDAETTHLEVIAGASTDGPADAVSRSKCWTFWPGRGADAGQAPRDAGGQERAPGRGAGVAGASRPAGPHAAGWQAAGLSIAPSGAVPVPQRGRGTERSCASAVVRARNHRCQVSTSTAFAGRSRWSKCSNLLGFEPSSRSGVQWYGRCPLHESRSAASPLVLGERGAGPLLLPSLPQSRATRSSSGRRPRSCRCIKPRSICASGSAATFPGFGVGDGSSVIVPSHRRATSPPRTNRSREEATGTLTTRQIGDIPSIILINGASITLITLNVSSRGIRDRKSCSRLRQSVPPCVAVF